MKDMNADLWQGRDYSGLMYGWQEGCLISRYMRDNEYHLFIYTGAEPRGEEGAQAQTARASQVAEAILQQTNSKDHHVKGVSVCEKGRAVRVTFNSKLKYAKHCDNFCKEVLPSVAPLCAPHNCYLCGQMIDHEAVPMLKGYGVMPAHPDCKITALEKVRNWKPKEDKKYSLIGGLIGALLGMLLGVLVWVGVGMLGYIASISGLVMAFAIGKGYDLLRGKPGKQKLALMIALVILGVALGTVGTTMWQIHEAYNEELASLTQFQKKFAMEEWEYQKLVLTDIFTTAEYLADFLKDVGLGLFFALLGCYGVLKMAGKHPDAPTLRELKGKI